MAKTTDGTIAQRMDYNVLEVINLKNKPSLKMVLATIGSALFVSIVVIGYTYYNKFAIKSRDTRCLSSLELISKAEQINFENHKEYSSDLKQIGITKFPKGISIFFSPDSLPRAIKDSLPHNQLPFVTKDSYLILVFLAEEKGYLPRLCMVTELSSPQMVQ